MLSGALFRRSFGHLRPHLTLGCNFHLLIQSTGVISIRNFTHVTPQSASSFLKPNCPGPAGDHIQKRFKKKKPSKSEEKQQQPSDDEEEDDEEKDELAGDEIVEIGFIDREINITANRFISILKAGLNIKRNLCEAAFLEGRVRVNGYLLTKKSEMGSQGDVIDLIKGRNQENPEFLDISRVEILSLPDVATNTGRIRMKVRAFRKLTIENYTEDPFDSQIINIYGEKVDK